jgi:hypothetical protein
MHTLTDDKETSLHPTQHHSSSRMSSGGSSSSSSSSASSSAASTANRNNTNAQPQLRFPPTWPQLDGSFLADVPPVRSLREWMRNPLRNEEGKPVKVCCHFTKQQHT